MRSRQEEEKMRLDSDPTIRPVQMKGEIPDPLIFKEGFIIQKDAPHPRPNNTCQRLSSTQEMETKRCDKVLGG